MQDTCAGTQTYILYNFSGLRINEKILISLKTLYAKSITKQTPKIKDRPQQKGQKKKKKANPVLKERLNE